jgi:hypothetical protein
MPTPTQQAQQPAATGQNNPPWWVSSGLMNTAHDLVNLIPSARLNQSWRTPIPAVSFLGPDSVISFGTVTNGLVASNANPNVMVNPDATLTVSTGKNPIVSVNSRPDGVDLTVRNPWQQYHFVDGQINGTLSSSATVRVTTDGFWNTTVGVDVNYPEVQVSGAGVKGRVSSGFYVEYKPWRVMTYTVLAPVIVAGVVMAAYYFVQTGDSSIFEKAFQH